MAVQTANTVQSENAFLAPNWIDESIVNAQLDLLLKTYQFKFVKIGLVKNIKSLNRLIKSCVRANPNVKIIWDPVLSASAGFDFKHDLLNIESVIKYLYLLTPNFEEITKLSGEVDQLLGAKKLSKYCKVLLKGGHNEKAIGTDILFMRDKVITFKPKPAKFAQKHGSGCVLASAIAANLAKDYPVQKSILRSKRYVEAFLSSNNTLIGAHKP